MRAVAVLAGCLMAAGAPAAVIRGIVLDCTTGRALARATVTVTPVGGTAAGGAGVRTAVSGQFSIGPLPAGAYLVAASRPGFAILRHGQKAWNAPGTPVTVERDGSVFLDLRLHRLGAITGTVSDENEIGVPEQDVVAYRASRPPVQVGRVRTDDRGVYRIFNLLPGQYFVRSGAKNLDEDGGFLPTFHNSVATVEEARSIEVRLDTDSTEAGIRPFKGRLCALKGETTPRNATNVAVSLISDMGPVGGGGSDAKFSFEHLAPGDYELTAEGRWYSGRLGAYRRVALERDTDGVFLQLGPFPVLRMVVEHKEGGKVGGQDVVMLARRKDLSRMGTPQPLKGDRNELMPGRWELAVTTAPYLYAVSMYASGQEDLQNARGDAWNEVMLEPGSSVAVRVRVSARPATLSGKVTKSISEAAAGVPVYLEPVAGDSPRRVAPVREVFTDERGQYRFAGLPPGNYRVLSTLDFDEPGEGVMEAARARTVSLKEAAETVQDLDLYVR